MVDPKYTIGQKVLIKPVNETGSRRSSEVDAYAGQIGEVSNYYWINPPTGKVFFIYNIKAGTGYKELVLYEDEIESCLT